MQYYALINNEQTGPFTTEQLSAMWQSGTINSNTMIWYEGLSEWIPLSTIEDDLKPIQQTRIYSPPVSSTRRTATDNAQLKTILGLAGAALMFMGVFCPIVSNPLIGEINFLKLEGGFGPFILVLAASTAILCLIQRFPLLWLTGLGSIGLLLFTFVSFQNNLLVQIQWGFAVIGLGAFLVIATAAIPNIKS